MLGVIVGDIVGSRFERKGIKSKDFDLFSRRCRVTDDSVMSLAIAKTILLSAGRPDEMSRTAVSCMREFGRLYHHISYGGMFREWLFSQNPHPYNSFGNGAAMRVSACGFAARDLDEAVLFSKNVTCVTHDHPEGLKGAEAVAVSVFMAKNGASKEAIRRRIHDNYYPLDFSTEDIRRTYRTDVTCQGCVPQSIVSFLDAEDFEDAIRNAVSLGGDCDTMAAIAGGIADAFYGVPDAIRRQALAYLDDYLSGVLSAFESAYPGRISPAGSDE